MIDNIKRYSAVNSQNMVPYYTLDTLTDIIQGRYINLRHNEAAFADGPLNILRLFHEFDTFHNVANFAAFSPAGAVSANNALKSYMTALFGKWNIQDDYVIKFLKILHSYCTSVAGRVVGNP